MKILLYGINFSPELTGIGKYTGEMARWLAQAGHEVHVIAGPPYYPGWRVEKGYKAWSYSCERTDGMKVYRTPLWVPKEPGGLKRIVHLASFALFSLPVLLLHWRWKPDVVWVVEPPLVCAPAAVLFAVATQAKKWLHIQDFEIDAAFELEIIRGAQARKFVEILERIIMRQFDIVSTISRKMMERICSKGIHENRVRLFRNWVDVREIAPLQAESMFRAMLGITREAVVVLYSGNMGNKQGLELLPAVARILEGTPLVQFVLCGNGSGRATLENSCIGLSNVQFLDLQPAYLLADLLGLADIHVLPQRAGAADLVMPSKLVGMLASARPVVVSAGMGTELATMVTEEGFGIVVAPENAEAMAQAILELVHNSNLRQTQGLRGRNYAERELDRGSVLSRFEQELLILHESA